MSKINKNLITGIIIGGVVFGTISVGASYLYDADQVTYNKDGSEITLNSAIGELYDKANSYKPATMTSYTVSTVTTITNTSTGVYGYTWDLKTIPNYQNLVLWSNLFIKLNQTYISGDTPTGGSAFSYSYDAPNGILTLTASCKQRPNGIVIYVLG